MGKESRRSDNNYLKAGSFYFIGNIFDKAVAFITVPVFTRLLSAADYGITSTYISWVTILSVIITLSLGNSVRTASLDFKDSIDQYISSIFCLGTISAIVMSTLCIVLNVMFNFIENDILIVLCCIESYTTSILATVKVRYLMDIKYIQRVLLQSIPNLIVVILSIILIKTMRTDKYMGRIYAYVIVSLLFGMFYLIYYLIKGRCFYALNYWKYALSFSLPLIFHSLSTVILSQSDRTMITFLHSAAETGMYSLAYQFGMVPTVFITTFENIWIPWFTKKMVGNDRNSVNTMVVPYINVLTLLCIGVMLVAPEILKLMSTPEYYGAMPMIGPVVAATYLMFLASISIDLEYYLKKTKTIALNTIVAAAINIVLNLIFIPKYGGCAAAYTTVTAYAVSFLMHYFVTRKLEPNMFPFKIYILPICMVAVVTIISTVFIDEWIIRWVIALFVGIAAITLIMKFMKLKREV